MQVGKYLWSTYNVQVFLMRMKYLWWEQWHIMLKNQEAESQWQKGLRRWHPTPVLLPGKSHGRRSLVGCSPWGREESDTTEQLHFHFSLSCIGEGNGNPLQCSCLENPRDGGAWWAALYGVTQSWTRLKLTQKNIKTLREQTSCYGEHSN